MSVRKWMFAGALFLAAGFEFFGICPKTGVEV